MSSSLGKIFNFEMFFFLISSRKQDLTFHGIKRKCHQFVVCGISEEAGFIKKNNVFKITVSRGYLHVCFKKN